MMKPVYVYQMTNIMREIRDISNTLSKVRNDIESNIVLSDKWVAAVQRERVCLLRLDQLKAVL